MRKTTIFAICLLLILSMASNAVFASEPGPGGALSAEQEKAIQELIDDAVRISGTPGISIAITSENETNYFNSGHTSSRDKNDSSRVDEHTLYEIGSLSKAFTGVGILLLQEQGVLSTADRIEEYLPWLYFNYQNERAAITIKNLLNHTSGLARQHSDAPRGEGDEMLRRTVEPLVGAELNTAPGTAFAYNNANYDILGLIIETVSGQSYSAFMEEQVFKPLGLHETYLSRAEAAATGRMAQGSRHMFFGTFPYDAPVYDGMKPAGFVVSSSSDMARWAGIHLGLVQDIPDIFLQVIKNAHQVDMDGPAVEGSDYYTSGWIIETGGEIVTHAGQTPSFMSDITLFTQQRQGILFLTNGGNVNYKIVPEIEDIMRGNTQQQYTMSNRQITDMFFSAIILLLLIATLANIAMGIRNRIRYKPQLTKKKMITVAVWAAVAVIMLVRLLNYPKTVGSGWVYIIDWNPPTATLILFVLPLFFASMAWHTYTGKPKSKPVKTAKTH